MDDFAPLLIVPEAADDAPDVGQLFGVLLIVTEDGTMCVDVDGHPVALPIDDPQVSIPIAAFVPLGVTQLMWVPETDHLLSYKQVAGLARCSLATVKRAVAEGRLAPPIKTGKRSVRFTAAAVKAWTKQSFHLGAAMFRAPSENSSASRVPEREMNLSKPEPRDD